MVPMGSPEVSEIGATPISDTAWGGRLRIRNILCPVDLSEYSRGALRYAVGLASHFQSRLYVQHTFQLPADAAPKSGGATLQVEDLPPSLQQEEVELRELLEKTGAGSTNTTLLLNEGDARQRILETIAGKGIDLLVIATHGRKGLSRLVRGSVTEQVIHEAPCPALVLSRPEPLPARGGKFDPVRLRTILVAVDLSINSARLLIYALRWASEAASQVILLHVVGTAPPAMEKLSDLLPEYDPNLEKRIRAAGETMRALVPSPDRFPCRVGYEVRDGEPRKQILRFANEKKTDLIVMGASIRKGAGLPWGSTISGVIRDGRFPVLAVRHLGDN